MSPSGSLDPATVLTHKLPRLALDPTSYRTQWGAQDCCILYYCGWFIHPRPAPSPCVVIAWENPGGPEPLLIPSLAPVWLPFVHTLMSGSCAIPVESRGPSRLASGSSECDLNTPIADCFGLHLTLSVPWVELLYGLLISRLDD